MSDTPSETPAASAREERRNGEGPDRARQSSHGHSREPSGRAQRIPLGSARQKGLADARPGFVRRWINNKGARIQYALQGGWNHVRADNSGAFSSDPGEGTSQVCGTQENGEPMRRYLMEIREDWFNEDQFEKENKRAEIEAQILRGTDDKGQPGKDGRYLRIGTKRIGL